MEIGKKKSLWTVKGYTSWKLGKKFPLLSDAIYL